MTYKTWTVVLTVTFVLTTFATPVYGETIAQMLAVACPGTGPMQRLASENDALQTPNSALLKTLARRYYECSQNLNVNPYARDWARLESYEALAGWAVAPEPYVTKDMMIARLAGVADQMNDLAAATRFDDVRGMAVTLRDAYRGLRGLESMLRSLSVAGQRQGSSRGARTFARLNLES